MIRLLRIYDVTAMMTVPLTCRVKAKSEEEAIAIAKSLIADGYLIEVESQAEIGDDQAREIIS